MFYIPLVFYTAFNSFFYRNMYKENEIDIEATCKDFLQVQTEGVRSVKRKQKKYNLDVIISVGYRVKSKRGVAFSKWATNILRNYLIEGYAVNEKRLAAPQKTVQIESRILAGVIG